MARMKKRKLHPATNVIAILTAQAAAEALSGDSYNGCMAMRGAKALHRNEPCDFLVVIVRGHDMVARVADTLVALAHTDRDAGNSLIIEQHPELRPTLNPPDRI